MRERRNRGTTFEREAVQIQKKYEAEPRPRQKRWDRAKLRQSPRQSQGEKTASRREATKVFTVRRYA